MTTLAEANSADVAAPAYPMIDVYSNEPYLQEVDVPILTAVAVSIDTIPLASELASYVQPSAGQSRPLPPTLRLALWPRTPRALSVRLCMLLFLRP